VTDRIVAALEKGTAPWVCPWDRSLGLPRNGYSGHVYSGVNTWLCWASGLADPRWFTFNQVREYGRSHVRRGEHGTHIVHWSFFDKKTTEKNAQGNETTRTERIPSLRTFVVFNHCQVEWDTDAERQPKPLACNDIDPLAACADAAALVEQSGAVVVHGGCRACYSPSADRIEMPGPAAFVDADNYWATLLHELGHWSGHGTRLDRKLVNRFGTEEYAAEELVAELTSAFLCADLGIQGQLRHAEYVASWLKILKGDRFAIFSAAKLARQAADFLTHRAADSDDQADAAEEAA